MILWPLMDLHSHCDRCGHQFSVTHSPACSLGSLVLAYHNELCDELAGFAAHAFTIGAGHDESLIHPCPQFTHVTASTPATSALSPPLSTPNDDHGISL